MCKDDPTAPRIHTRERNDGFNDRPLDDVILQDANEAINHGQHLSLSYKVRNTNRSVCTKVSGEIAYQHGEEGLPEGLLEINLRGSAGQSLGAFLSPGIRLVLNGEANDYVGKGMSGGAIIIKPRPSHPDFVAHESMIAGNTCLYGATGGFLFANGRAGERFAVRNSGVTAVVEGVGDHGCEYMTNGTVVVLGATGRNFGAGMTGGTAYVLDLNDAFEGLYNPQLIRLDRFNDEDARAVKALIYQHLEATESVRAQEIMADWPRFQAKFWKAPPRPPAQPAGPAAVAAKAPATVPPAAQEVMTAANPK